MFKIASIFVVSPLVYWMNFYVIGWHGLAIQNHLFHVCQNCLQVEFQRRHIDLLTSPAVVVCTTSTAPSANTQILQSNGLLMNASHVYDINIDLKAKMRKTLSLNTWILRISFIVDQLQYITVQNGQSNVECKLAP